MTNIPVCVFAKPPVPGYVKTRLARSIGSDAAAALASAMLRDVWSTVQITPKVRPVLAASETGLFPISVSREDLWLQDPGDLGWRIESVLRRGLVSAPAAVVLGGDSPLITPAHLQAAIELLGTYDAVVGPSEDGGFYLLGTRACPEGLLADLPWSVCETCHCTEERLRSRSMHLGTLPVLADIDGVAELRELQRQLDALPPGVAPHTRAWMDEHKW